MNKCWFWAHCWTEWKPEYRTTPHRAGPIVMFRGNLFSLDHDGRSYTGKTILRMAEKLRERETALRTSRTDG